MSTENLHEGHRQRMWEKLDSQGPDVLNEHQVLEMLLFSAVPRGDTNPMAHELINRFGSLSSVFEATEQELTEIPGVGKKVAQLLRIIPTVSRFYFQDKGKPCFRYDTVWKLCDYGIRLFVGVQVEQVHAMLLDNKMKLLDEIKLSEGTTNSASVSARKVVEQALRLQASNVVLFHNHPMGVARPSRDDLMFTDNMESALGMMDIDLIEHIVIGEGRAYPIMYNRKTDSLSDGMGNQVVDIQLNEKKG